MTRARREALFEAVFARDGGRCAYCGIEVRRRRRGLHRAPDLATLDHLRPRSMGGALDLGNLVLACQACNGARGVIDPETFRARMRAQAEDPIRTLLRDAADEKH